MFVVQINDCYTAMDIAGRERIWLQAGKACFEHIDRRASVLDPRFDPQSVPDLREIRWPCPDLAKERPGSLLHGKFAVLGGWCCQ